ncbi:MAG: peroxidase-related enzyme [Ignavibacteriae bacterium]|nr:peroxidase-related enzyme [Ignavibacteriota bacterium]
MAFIHIITENKAEGELKKLYEDYRAPWDGVDNILKIHSLLPHTLKPHVDLYRTVMFGKGPLTRRQREMIATVVSKANSCTYCVHHHSDALLRVTKDKPFTSSIRNDYRTAAMSDAERAMLHYSEELTRNPTQDFSQRVHDLKNHGFSEEAILHMTLIIGYFNFVNRIAIGLGVELESYWNEDGYSDPSKPMAHDR